MIRTANKSDSKSVAILAHMMWSSSIGELTKEFDQLIESDEGEIFLAEEQGQVIAFAQCQLRHDYVEGTDNSPVGYLEGIFVKEEFRNKNYAKNLLKKCEKWAKEKGCSEFASDCELNNNASLKFHLNLGFEEANRIICFTKAL